MQIPIEISARHVHVSQSDLETLFGAGYALHPQRQLSQTGEFATEETLQLVGSKGEIRARIIGPVRARTQVELSRSDARALGIEAPLRLSGDLTGSSGLRLVGVVGEVEISEGVIVPLRHLHISTADAAAANLVNGQRVRVRISGERGGILDNVIVRSGEKFTTALHLDTDEGNAFGIGPDNSAGELLND